MFFETYFNLWDEAQYEKEIAVCCPIPHTKSDGSKYYEHNASCHINLEKRLWNCKSCGAGGNEVQMVQQVLNCSVPRATKFLSMLKRGIGREDIKEQLNGYELTEDNFKSACNLGMFNRDVLADLDVMIEQVNNHYEFHIPAYYKGRLIDIRTYRPGIQPKVLSVEGAPAGFIIPFDQWQESDPNRWTLLMAGEKDMICARSLGFNAITLTGGEVTSPISAKWFEGRRVAIVYDNDDPGRMGARKIAKLIAPYATRVRVIEKFHEDFEGTDTKEDFTDWVLNYEGTYDRMVQYIQETEDFVMEEAEQDDECALVTLTEAIDPKYHGSMLRSTVQVLTTSDTPFEIPSVARVKKLTSDKGKLEKGATVTWSLEDDPTALFKLVGGSVDQVDATIRRCLYLGAEKGTCVDIQEREVVYICQVSDMNASYEDMSELTAFCVGVKPVQGKRYTLRYLRTTDTNRGCVAMIVDKMEDAVDDISTFVVDETTKESLVYAQHVEGNVAERISHRAQAVRGVLGYECNEDLITAIDMTFNTVKEFDYGINKDVKGYMDTLVIGESRVGKSDTSKRLRDVYKVGAFVSLAGSAATIAGVVGGSVKDALGRQSTRAGAIPRNHGGIIIFEELAKARDDMVRSLTDVRSSGLARITRVSGSIEMPASLRMLTLSNCRALPNGETRPIAEYSSGIEITKDLIGTAEDIARYDMVFVLGDTGETSDPLYDPPEPYPEHVMRDLVRWTWSRTAEQIKFISNSDRIIRDLANDLNNTYPLHIKLFGTECWKKLARLSIAAACYTVSTDDTYENVLVTPEHVQWAYNFLKKIYDNDTFKLSAVVALHKAQSEVDPADTAKLQDFFIKYKQALTKLYTQSKMDKKTFKELANIDDRDFAPLVRTLIARDFVNSDREMMYVTMKFKETFKLLNTNTEVPRV